jgi:RNA polymerase sigma-70 factor (ECF subfamily)
MGDDRFAGFYTASYQRLLGQLFAVAGDLAEAENLLQEAYARAFTRWAQVCADDSPEAWVRRVALNLAAMAAKRLRRRAVALWRLGPPPVVPELSPELLDLHHALGALPLGQRQVIVLHHLVGLPVEEAAGELGGRPGRSSPGWLAVAGPWPRCSRPTGRRLRRDEGPGPQTAAARCRGDQGRHGA